MPPDSDTINVHVPGTQERAEIETQIQNEIDMETTEPATPTQSTTPSQFEIPILPPNKRQANFSPEIRTRSNF